MISSHKLFLLQALLLAQTSFLQSRLSHDCGSKLLDGCFCGLRYHEQRTSYVVNCTDMNFASVDMLQHLPAETEVLIFTGNNIPTLPWNVFGDLNNLTKLGTIDMSNNKIREIKGKSYHHVPNVVRLILNHNNLTISNAGDENLHHPRVFSNFINLQELHLTNTFADNTDAALAEDLHDIFVNSELKKLFKLHLEQNEIKSFRDANVFCDLPALEQLYLGDNSIPSMNFNIKCLPKLTFLDLEHNNISKFTQKDFGSFDELAPPKRRKESPLMIDISRNPLKCESASPDLYEWMQHTKVTVRNKEHLQCYLNRYGPNVGVNILTLSEGKHAKVSKAITVLLVILVLVLVTLLAAYAYLSKEKIRAKLGPLFEKVGRKVQYSTIESQDV